MAEREVIVCRDVAELGRQAAERFVGLAARATERQGRFTAALSGGSTPKVLYSLLARPDFSARIPWPKVHLFWGDERCVPPDHADSNYRMAREALLTKVDLPPENIHRLAGEKEPQSAAQDYEAELKKTFRLDGAALPRFDLVLLGLGEDGHTASLFPGSAALDETRRLVAANFVEKLNSHRLTLTFPVLNHAASVIFLVAGASKAAVVDELLGAGPAKFDYPAARIRPQGGTVSWIITADAAAQIRAR